MLLLFRAKIVNEAWRAGLPGVLPYFEGFQALPCNVEHVMTRRVVLYIDSLKTGGAERVTLFCTLACGSGWQATVLIRHGASRDFYPVPAGVQRVSNPRSDWLRRFCRWASLRVLRLRAWSGE